ncbi:MAG: hypothetical protein K940chlam7_00683 [Chlamydiae bacterium]|nr:hypothetical protein [Chlamydiota bacterium]
MTSESSVPSIRPDSYRPVASEPEKGTKCPLFKLLNKIWSAVKWIFHKIAGLFSPSPLKNLSERDIEIIQNAERMTAHRRPGELPKEQRRRNVITAEALLDPTTKLESKDADRSSGIHIDLIEHKPKEGLKEKEPPPEIKNPVMREFYQTGQEFVDLLIDTVFDKKVKPKLSGYKEGLDSASNGIKFGADFVIQVGDRAAKPFFEMLKKYKVEEALEPVGKHLLSWLIQDVNKDTFEINLQKKMKREFEKNETSESFTDPCVSWLWESKGDKPLATSYQEAGVEISENESLIEKTYETALLILVEHQIDQYIAILHKKLDDRFPELIHEMMKTNAQKISDIVLRRMIDLLENVEYTDLSSEVIGLACDQTNAVVAFEGAKKNRIKEEEETLERAKKAKKMTPKPGEEDTKEKLVTYLGQVDTYGEESWKKRIAVQDGLQTYSENPICHPEIRKLIQNPHTTKTEREELEKKVYQDFADKVLPALFPKQKVQLPDGTVEEVDGLIFLLNQIEIPEEFQELLKKAEDLGKKIVSENTQGVLRSLSESLWDIAYERIEKLIIENIVKQEINKAMVFGIKELYEKVITPKLFTEIMGQNALPAIQRALIKGMTKEVMFKNRKEYYSDFEDITYTEDLAKREESITSLCKKLYGSAKGACKESRKAFEELSFKEYQKIVLPLVEEIESGIVAYKESKGSEGAKDRNQIVREALEGYFKTIDHGKDSRLGEIAVNAAFKIGELSSTAEKLEFWIKNLISDKFTDVVHPFVKSPDELLKVSTEAIRENYLDEEKMKKLLFEKSKEVSIDEANGTLKKEITKTAEFAYDMIFQSIESSGWSFLIKPAAKIAIGSNASKLDETIGKVFHSLFGNKVMTQNLLVRAQDLVMDALMASSKKIGKSEAMKPVKVKRLPTLVPECLVT